MRSAKCSSRRRETQWLCHGPGTLLRSQCARHLHPCENPFLTLLRQLEAPVWIQPRGRLWQAGEEGRLRRAQVAQGLREVMFSRRRAACVQAAVVDAVEVGGEDALLVPDLFESQRLRRLNELGPPGAWTPSRQLDELLREGGAAGNHAAMPCVLPERAEGRTPVHAVMMPEALVLSGERRINE